MPQPISAITAISLPAASAPARAAAGAADFAKALEGALQKLQGTQDDAREAVQKFLSGESDELHSTVLATQRAEIAFELGLQVRNKVVQAYQEIMRMQM